MALKTSSFDKFRLPSAVRHSAAACLFAAMSAGGRASAGVVNLDQSFDAGGVRYGTVGNSTATIFNAAGIAGTGAGYGIGEASIIGGKGDAFDGGAGIRVNGTYFNQPGNQVDMTTTANGVFLNTITPMDIGGISTTYNYYMTENRTVRAVGSFTNTTVASANAKVIFGGNLGSDSATTIFATSSGDLVYSPTIDTFYVSGQTNGSDAFQTNYLFAAGSNAPTFGRVGGTWGGNGGFNSIGYDLTIAAGETKSLMWFVQFSETATAATADVGNFTDLATLDAAGLLAGLSQSDVDRIDNWQPRTIPEPSALSLLVLGFSSLMLGRYRWSRVKA